MLRKSEEECRDGDSFSFLSLFLSLLFQDRLITVRIFKSGLQQRTSTTDTPSNGTQLIIKGVKGHGRT